jgi:hypothetical protein
VRAEEEKVIQHRATAYAWMRKKKKKKKKKEKSDKKEQ